MIKTKKELDFYLKTDLMMNRGAFKKSLKVRLKDIIVPDYIMEYKKAAVFDKDSEGMAGEASEKSRFR